MKLALLATLATALYAQGPILDSQVPLLGNVGVVAKVPKDASFVIVDPSGPQNIRQVTIWFGDLADPNMLNSPDRCLVQWNNYPWERSFIGYGDTYQRYLIGGVGPVISTGPSCSLDLSKVKLEYSLCQWSTMPSGYKVATTCSGIWSTVPYGNAVRITFPFSTLRYDHGQINVGNFFNRGWMVTF